MTDIPTGATGQPPKPEEIQANEITIMSSAHRYKWRDIGLFLIAIGLCVNAFLGWVAESNHKRSLAELAAESKEAIDKANKNMDVLQTELNNVKKSAVATDLLKKDMVSEFTRTRKMIEEVRKTVDRIEKGMK